MFDFKKEYGLDIIKELVSDDKNLSRIYGFILYTYENYNVSLVLNDDSFWYYLDQKSGRNWPIFVLRPFENKKKQQKNSLDDDPYISFMIYSNYKIEQKSDIRIFKDFEIDEYTELPLFIVFMWDDQDNLKKICVKINDESLESARNSLSSIVRIISETESRIQPEYKKTEAVFREVKTALENYETRCTFSKILNFSEKLRKLFIDY